MSPEEIKTIIEEAIQQRFLFQWWHYIVWILIAALGAYIGTYLKEKGKNLATSEDIKKITEEMEMIKSFYTIELEKVKAEIKKSQQSINNAISSYTSNSQAFLPQRAQAMDALWKAIIEAKQKVSNNLVLYDLCEMSPTAKKEFGKSTEIRKMFVDQTHTSILKENSDIVDKVTQHRIFLGEKLWLIFTQFLSFLIIIKINMIQAIEKKEPPTIYEDKETLNFLKNTLSENEYNLIFKKGYMHLRWAVETFEQRILKEVNKIISGKEASINTLQQIIELEKINKKLNTDNK